MSEKEITATLQRATYNSKTKQFMGLIYGDKKKRFLDGALIITSKTISIEKDENGQPIYCDTLNSRYKLECL